MSSFQVEGGHKLRGAVGLTGNKNEALPLISAACLCEKEVTFTNMPRIGDVEIMLDIARHLGARVSPLQNRRVTIDASSLHDSLVPLDLSRQIRASLLFASVLLVRTGRAVLPRPGGDAIGRRRVDTHFLVLQKLGAHLSVERTASPGGTITTYTLHAPNGLHGADILLDEASVTATENGLIAAAGARGRTVIHNAASEPHVQGLCRFLCAIDVEVTGIGSNVLTIEGGETYCGATHAIGCDYIEAGSLIGLAAATGSSLTITGIDSRLIRMILYQFNRIGVEVVSDTEAKSIHVPGDQKPVIQCDFGGALPKIEDGPWPGFPADLTSILLVAATQSKGTCLIHEKMFEARLFFVDKLLNMGANIILCDPHRAVVSGPSQLFGSTMSSPDIRAGMALLIAACAAEGRSIIHNIEQIDRGYYRIEKRLNERGAVISRLEHE